jgi:hypothetical protein
VPATLSEVPGIAWITLTLGRARTGSYPSTGKPAGLDYFEKIVGPVTPPATGPALKIGGWATAAVDVPSVFVRSRDNSKFELPTTMTRAPDVETAYPGTSAARFELNVLCPPTHCDLVIRPPLQADTVVPLAGLAVGPLRSSPGASAFVESLTTETPVHLPRPQHAVARQIARGYLVIAPLGFALGVLGLALAMVRSRLLSARDARLVPLALGSLVAVCSRIALLAFLEATSIPSANALYASPATPFVLLVAALGIYLGWAAHHASRSQA